MKINEIVQALGLTERTIMRWVKHGLPRKRVDGLWDYDLEVVRGWSRMQKTGTKMDPVGVDGLPVKDRMKSREVPPLDIPTSAQALERLKARKYDEAMAALERLTRVMSKAEKEVEAAKTPQQRLAEAEEEVRNAEIRLSEALALVGSGGVQKWGSGVRQEQPEVRSPRKVVVQSVGRVSSGAIANAVSNLAKAVEPMVDPFSDPQMRQEAPEFDGSRKVADYTPPPITPVSPPVVPVLTSDQPDGLAGVVGARVTPKKDGGLFDPI